MFLNPRYLLTTFIRVEGQDAGFVALDPARRAIEVIYINPEHRRRGLAARALRHIADAALPQRLALKTPLSPGGDALADRLDLARADNLPHEQAKNEEALRVIRDGIKATCTHGKKGGGDPRKPCQRCYRKTLRRYAAMVIDKYVTERKNLR
ncbi:GNAT family acetyltransferase [Streptomyces sp. SPB074]|nr:GNAT family acetyltransferase [Streptomyces sp. SPB074]